MAERIGAALEIVGAYCIEFFVAAGEIYVNEIAPRVHNSGHYSLDATQISQYEAHVRAICDLPLVEPKLFEAAVMVNILGTGSGDYLAGAESLLRDPDVKLHVYGKRHAALRRERWRTSRSSRRHGGRGAGEGRYRSRPPLVGAGFGTARNAIAKHRGQEGISPHAADAVVSC